ncbi:DHS-like NAD/FAD-binding domain-containing protein [Cercophora samala]|uniref:DHS-like NAD/FAD-binding domain-containing protein n=1 Tax=Cercophora samala TaxID=330535 RepID=A0AA40DDQ5_9PEZI|nr:DHS-like NAD/FAD-binding domain-containing protein [Cercophora samala]
MEAKSRTPLPDGGQKKKVKGRSKSPTTATTVNGTSNGASEISRKSSTRVRNVVDYDEKRAFVGLDSDPVVAPRTSPSAHHQNGNGNGNGAVKKVATNGSGLNELEERVQDLGDSWETESLLNDILGDVHEDRFFPDGLSPPSPACRFTPNGNFIFFPRPKRTDYSQRPRNMKKKRKGPTDDDQDVNSTPDVDACTPEEAIQYRQMLRALGPEIFVQRTVDAGRITAKKMLTAFGVKPPDFLEGQDDDAYFSLLSYAFTRELKKRAKLTRYNTVDDAVALLKEKKNIIVLTGAGISTSLGIPDFRSAGTGLYSKLAHLGLNDPQEVFDLSVFKQDPTIFYSVAKDILPSEDRYTPTHQFIRMLQERGKLLTNYTQNIDNLESKAGILPEKLIQCHGSFATASCVKCGEKVIGDTIFAEIKAGKIPRCKKCPASQSRSQSRKRKTANSSSTKRRRTGADFDRDSNSDSEFDLVSSSSAGVMKPDIIFFGEPLPDEFSQRLTQHDVDRVDLVIVIGTSLKVAPVSEVVPYLPSHIPQIYISREAIGHNNFDIDLLGDCDVVVAELCRRAGWELGHEMVPEGQEVRVRQVEGWGSRWVFKEVGKEGEGEKEKEKEGGDKNGGESKNGEGKENGNGKGKRGKNIGVKK